MKISIVFFLLTICSLFHEGINLSDGKFSNTCDKIVLEQYNVNPTTCSSNFIIKSSQSTYTIDEPIHVTIQSTLPDKKFVGIYLFAQDTKNINVGSWKITDLLIESVSCGGLMHSSKIEKTSIETVWYPSSNVVGDVMIKAIIIENDNTIYIDCYNIILTPQIINYSSFTDETSLEPNTTTTTSTTTQNTTTTTTLTTTSASGNTTQTPSPAASVSINVTWTFNNEINVTNVVMSVYNLKSSQWAAIGLGVKEAMGEAHVFMCKQLANNTIVINRYINPNKHEHPEHAGSEQGGILTPVQQQFRDGVVICQFTLSNFNIETFQQLKTISPLSQTASYHPLFAVGLLNSTNDPQKHFDDSHTALSEFVQLNQNKTILYKINSTDDGGSLTFVRVHGVIMVFTWILIISTGVLISRYFKNSWATNFICGKAAWFAAHRFLMSMGAILTVLGFLFILVFNQGSWVEKGPTRAFAHSITGVIAISFAFFQPFIALFRCEPDSRFRFIFNYIHAFVGFSAFILSIAALFLATYFRILKDTKARLFMILWIGWIGLIFIAFEIIQSYFRKKSNESGYSNINVSNTTIGEIVESPKSSTTNLTHFVQQQENTLERKLKHVLLAIHVLIAVIIAIMMTIFIFST
ncbi:unnamed protein product [Rotaria sordida]|uniref:Ferric-chelate reductase 1 n=1 Tax=Rotaria sordida TaxID=392033 RepID=A0A813R3F1_9BILA|nr:unnamed protein product [Rotaria sordida]CAF0808282.1 unnamed protein product [Rotaria sordida]